VMPALILVDSVMMRREEPVLASFESPLEMTRWGFGEAHATRSREHATAGAWSMKLDMDRGTYPGALLNWLIPDWSSYHALEWDTYLEPGPPLDLVVKIEDATHNGRYEDRFHGVVRLIPGPNHSRIELADVERGPRGRKLDLRRIRRLHLFTIRPRMPRTIYFDEIRLR